MGFDEFLRKAALRLGLQWRPFQRRGIQRRVERRMEEIGLSNFKEYLLRIEEDPDEQNHLSKMLTVTISRFFRDKEVFDTFGTSLIPAIVKNRKEGQFRVWSIGCASGEEPYSIALLWKKSFAQHWPFIQFSVLATDVNESLLERAMKGRYKKSSLREVPQEILQIFFKANNDFYALDQAIFNHVEFKRHDIINEETFSEMDIIFCRNLAFTYFSKECQIKVLKKIANGLKKEGYLVIGKDEALPLVYPTLFTPVFSSEKIYQKFNLNSSSS